MFLLFQYVSFSLAKGVVSKTSFEKADERSPWKTTWKTKGLTNKKTRKQAKIQEHHTQTKTHFFLIYNIYNIIYKLYIKTCMLCLMYSLFCAKKKQKTTPVTARELLVQLLRVER